MKSTGIIRRVDELGRIVLPAELRRRLDIGEKDNMEILVQDDTVIMRKYSPTCLFCENASDLAVFRGKNVCMRCLKQLHDLIEYIDK